jgi:glycosyltransferase involved in cell wall biosynthesis
MALRGEIDRLSASGIGGWAQDLDDPQARVSLLVTADDELVGRVLASGYRSDLQTAGIGDGRHAFGLALDVARLLRESRVIRVRRESDGVDVPGSPIRLRSPGLFDASARHTLANLLAQSGSQADIEAKIDFLAQESEKLMQQLADRDSGRARRRRDEDLSRRWRWRLPQNDLQPAADAPPPRALRRALVIDERTPKRGRDAGSNALLSHIESLQRLGFEVALAATADYQQRAVEADAGDLDAIGVLRFRAPYYGSVEEAMQRQAGEFDLVYLHRLSSACRYGDLARHYFPKARILYSIADLHHLRLARQAAAEQRPELAQASRLTLRRELLAMGAVDAVITHSTFEADLLNRLIPPGRVHVVTWPAPLAPIAAPFSERSGLAFVGFYGHQPNLDAARWLIDEIMPLARKSDPSVECLLVGPGMPWEVERLCGEGCVAAGAVEDLADLFARVRLTVAPLAFGAGIKGKVIDSLAAGVPCVCTPVAAEGLELPAPLRAYVADDAAGLAAAIVRLHQDAEANAVCSRAGLAHVAERFCEAQVDAAMRRAVGA